jgi:hypothetical protein
MRTSSLSCLRRRMYQRVEKGNMIILIRCRSIESANDVLYAFLIRPSAQKLSAQGARHARAPHTSSLSWFQRHTTSLHHRVSLHLGSRQSRRTGRPSRQYSTWNNVGVCHRISVACLYTTDVDEWATSQTFGRDDLPLLAKVADMAHT